MERRRFQWSEEDLALAVEAVKLGACAKPYGDTEQELWIQCDLCQLWYGAHCAGIAGMAPPENFMCSDCTDED